jgi:hypothetical protein
MNITSAKCLADLIVHLFKRSPSASVKPIDKSSRLLPFRE